MEFEGTPAYLRLRDCIAGMILSGDYRDGDMLPSLRSFATEQGANPLTVAKAYQSFQEEGLIVVKRGIGMFLAEGATQRLRVSERQRFLDHYWPRIHKLIDQLDLSPEELLRGKTASDGSKAPIAA